jgi:aliphatic sulfonates family ABC transporter substrate-binding protein
MGRHTNTMLAWLGAAALAVALPAHAQEVVNYGVQPATQPIYIAKALGLLDPIEKQFNVKIVFRNFSYGAPENQAMAAGALQIASAGMGPAIVAAARLPAKLVAISILEQTAILVPIDSPIKSVKDLKGKKVAFPGEGSQQYPLLLKALSDAGLKASDIELFKTKGSDIPTLLKEKSVDAGITWDPHVSNALAGGYARVLLKAEQIMPIMQGHYIGNGEYAREEFIAKNPALVQALIDANVMAIDYILKDPKGAAKLWSEQIGFPVKVIDYSLEQGISVYSHSVVPEKSTIAAYTKFLKDAKILRPDDDPKVDPHFAEQALRDVKGH